MRGPVRAAAGFVAALLVLAALVAAVGPDRVAAGLLAADPLLVAAAVAAAVAALFAWVEMNRRSLHALEEPSPDGRFRPVYLAGLFVRSVAPGGYVGTVPIVGYVLAGGLDLEYERTLVVVSAAEFCNKAASAVVVLAGVGYLLLDPAASGTLVEAGVAFVVMLSLGLGVTYVALLWYDGGTALLLAAAGLVRRPLAAVSSRLAAPLSREALEGRLDRIGGTVSTIRASPGALLWMLALAHLGWLCYALALYFSLWAVGARVPFPALLFVAPVAGSVAVLSLPGGLGVVESALTGLLALLSAHEFGTLVAGAFLFRLGTYWLTVALSGGVTAHLALRGAIPILSPFD